MLDIGCGRGLTPIILAAANPGWDVTGIDLQPAHIAEAREIAADAGLDNARFIEADVAGLDAARAERLLPEADIVLCHGVWTWVPDVVREGIVELLRARVKPGGIVLMGYNALPAQAPYIALQRLLQDSVRGVPGTPAERGAHALGVLARIRAIGSPHLPPRGGTRPHHRAGPGRAGLHGAPVVHRFLAAGLPGRPGARPGPRAARLRGPGAPGGRHGRAFSCARRSRPAWPPCRHGWTRRRASMPFSTGASGSISSCVGGGRRRATRSARSSWRWAATRPGRRCGCRPRPAAPSLSPAQQAALLGALSSGPKRLADLAALPGADGLSAFDIAVMLTETFIAHPLWRDAAPDAGLAARAARCNRAVLQHFGIEAEASGTPLGAVALGLGSGVPASAVDLGAIAALQAGLPAEAGALARHLAPPGADAQAQDALADRRSRGGSRLTWTPGAPWVSCDPSRDAGTLPPRAMASGLGRVTHRMNRFGCIAATTMLFLCRSKEVRP